MKNSNIMYWGGLAVLVTLSCWVSNSHPEHWWWWFFGYMFGLVYMIWSRVTDRVKENE